MNLSQGLYTSHEQKLIITPELKQSLAVLHYNQFELQEYIREQILDNPVMEPLTKDSFNSLKLQRSNSATSDDLSGLRQNEYTNELFAQPNLGEFLMSQLGCLKLSANSKYIIGLLIDQLDDKGYLTADLKEISKDFHIPVDVLNVCLDLLQHFDPIGVGARSLSECLSLQLSNFPEDTQLALEIVEKSMDDLIHNRLHLIAKKHQIHIDQANEAMEIIKKANPKPGSAFKSWNHIPYIQPDIMVRLEDNQPLIHIDTQYSCPTISISRTYLDMLKAPDLTPETKTYIEDKLKQASRLQLSIEQRKTTLLGISQSIVQAQSDFFTKPKGQLKPLLLKDLASMLDLHESTISRGIHGKYLQCDRGTFPLKHFFQSSLPSGDKLVSSEFVRNRIRQLVDSENKHKPLSDQAIADHLKEDLTISRRTIAKYRNQLSIPSATLRKKY